MEHFIEIFQPHRSCWLMREDLILTHSIGGIMIASAYYLIPILLFYITRKYKFDFRLKVIFWTYAAFIFLCGTTHILDVVMIWKINNFIITADGYLRILTGAVSWFSAGVTVWAAHIFFSLLSHLSEIVKKMKKERREEKRISSETWEDFRSAMADVEKTLQRGN